MRPARTAPNLKCYAPTIFCRINFRQRPDVGGVATLCTETMPRAISDFDSEVIRNQPLSEVELQIIKVDQGCAVAALLVRCYAPRNSLFGCKFSLLRRLGNFVLKQLYFLPKARAPRSS